MTIDVREATTGTAPRAGRWWALGAIVLSGLVIGLDTTILITALPTLSAKLGATTSQLQWLSDPDAGFGVGVHRFVGHPRSPTPGARMFSFVAHKNDP